MDEVAKQMPAPSQLGYSTNNVYDNFPPLMSDGREIIASHQPEALTNNYLIQQLGIKSNWEYRKYLTDNAKDIMKYNCINASNDVGFTRRYTNDPVANNSPMTAVTYMTNPVGYESGDLKSLYLSREELDYKSTYDFRTQEELLKYR
jgi:hypothetical protein